MVTKVDEVIEREPFGRLQLALLALISGAVIIDGFDIQAIGFVAPVLLKEWGLTRADLGPVISAALIGMAIGAPLGGRLGDHWGRRIVIVASTVFFGVMTLLTSLASDVNALTLIRFVSGIGFGALLPNATALIAEWMPSRLRSQAISFMIIGVPVGGMFGAAVSSALITTYGWRACFVVGGVLSLVMAAILLIALPESLRFLTQRSPDPGAVARLLNRAFGAERFSRSDTFVIGEVAGRAGWMEIFASEHRRVTIGLAVAFFANLFVFYAFANWVPTLLTSMGVALDVAIRGSFFFNLWGLPGALGGAALVSRTGSRPALLAVLAGAIVTSAVLGFLIQGGNPDRLLLMTALSAAGACVGGLQAALYALAAAAYPIRCRSTGVGFASGVGRLGPIASGFGGALLLALPGGHATFFAALVVALFVAASGVLIVDRHTHSTRSMRSSVQQA